MSVIKRCDRYNEKAVNVNNAFLWNLCLSRPGHKNYTNPYQGIEITLIPTRAQRKTYCYPSLTNLFSYG